MKKYKLGALNVSDKGLQDTKEEIVIELIDRMQKYVADGKAAFKNGSFTTEQKLNLNCTQDCGQERKWKPRLVDRIKSRDVPKKWTKISDKNIRFGTRACSEDRAV